MFGDGDVTTKTIDGQKYSVFHPQSLSYMQYLMTKRKKFVMQRLVSSGTLLTKAVLLKT